MSVLALALAACGLNGRGEEDAQAPTLRISAIPDQDPHELAERETALATYLADELGLAVEYVPVTDYAATVSLFSAGDLDLVFFGGLTGVQARLQARGAEVLAQRDIDEEFRSVFIVHRKAGINAFDDVADLAKLRGTTFTFGSESSTSGRLMPEHFLAEAGLNSAEDFSGPPGFSGSHDLTVNLVEAGAYEAGVVNAQVWEARKEAGTVDLNEVTAVFTTPAYRDYHWVAGPHVDNRLGRGVTEQIRDALLAIDGSDEEESRLLQQYRAGSIVASDADGYDEIEQTARDLNLIPRD